MQIQGIGFDEFLTPVFIIKISIGTENLVFARLILPKFRKFSSSKSNIQSPKTNLWWALSASVYWSQ